MSKPLMIAHRGYAGYEKENTLVSFTAAGAKKEYYGIETDVHVSKDNHYVIIHDNTTDRVSNGKYCIDVEKSTFKQIQKVRLSDNNYPESERYDLVIPELIDYLRICKRYNKVAILELKQIYNSRQINRIIKIVKEADMMKQIVFISFFLDDLILVRQKLKRVPLQWLVGPIDDSHIAIMKEHKLDCDIQFNALSVELIEKLHANNILVNCWTVDAQEDADRLASWGVDFITSNRLDHTN